MAGRYIPARSELHHADPNHPWPATRACRGPAIDDAPAHGYHDLLDQAHVRSFAKEVLRCVVVFGGFLLEREEDPSREVPRKVDIPDIGARLTCTSKRLRNMLIRTTGPSRRNRATSSSGRSDERAAARNASSDSTLIEATTPSAAATTAEVSGGEIRSGSRKK